MIGDKIETRQEYLDLSVSIVKHYTVDFFRSHEIKSIAIGGESGCGKSTLSIALQKTLESYNIKSVVLHQDDYFFLPPKTNHKKRLSDITNVGTLEVDIAHIERHIEIIKSRSSKSLKKPLIHYDLDIIRHEILTIDEADVVIIDGTYTMLLQNVDIKLFMSKNFLETKEYRKARNRDPMSPFNEEVLLKEHKIIAKQKAYAHFIIDKNLTITASQII